jgi:hypothetical protein
MGGIFLMPPETIATEGTARNPLNKRSPLSAGSLEQVHSLEAPAPWANSPVPGLGPEEEQALTEIPLPLEDVMAALQGFLTAQGIFWFHPNDRCFVGRANDKSIYVEFEAMPSGAGQIDIFVRLLRGAAFAFAKLIEEVTTLVQKMVDRS